MYLDESLNLCYLISIVSFDSAEFTEICSVNKILLRYSLGVVDIATRFV